MRPNVHCRKRVASDQAEAAGATAYSATISASGSRSRSATVARVRRRIRAQARITGEGRNEDRVKQADFRSLEPAEKARKAPPGDQRPLERRVGGRPPEPPHGRLVEDRDRGENGRPAESVLLSESQAPPSSSVATARKIRNTAPSLFMPGAEERGEQELTDGRGAFREEDVEERAPGERVTERHRDFGQADEEALVEREEPRRQDDGGGRRPRPVPPPQESPDQEKGRELEGGVKKRERLGVPAAGERREPGEERGKKQGVRRMEECESGVAKESSGQTAGEEERLSLQPPEGDEVPGPHGFGEGEDGEERDAE